MADSAAYARARDREQLRILAPAIAAFAANYRPGRPTVILFPGGLFSTLRQATTPFVPNGKPVAYEYTTLWISPDLKHDAANLAMRGDVDENGRIGIADGAIRIGGHGPYDVFQEFAASHGYNVFVFGWDWRRRVEPLARFFDTAFLPALQHAVMAQHGAAHDPLANFTVAAHSFGGLLLYTWLWRGSRFARAVANTVTIGSPLYGYGGEVHRFFAGYAKLNAYYSRAEIARICASMPGSYMLLPMPHDIWLRDRAVFENDAYPLTAYPCSDAADVRLSVDPYHPTAPKGLVRYPTGAWFMRSELPVAHALLRRITARLPPEMARKTHNWRGVRTGASASVPLADTCWSQGWKAIPPGFDPDRDPDPITDHLGPGDGTIPAWAARLAGTPPANLRTFGGDVQHGLLLEDPGILAALAGLIEPAGAAPVAAAMAPRKAPVASREALDNFMAADARHGREAVANPAADLPDLVRRGLADAERP